LSLKEFRETKVHYRPLTTFEWHEVDETLKVVMPKLGKYGKWNDIVPKGI
jgi:hypothetical protein